MDQQFDWDVFVSHASEDKEAIVLPLANELRRLGLSVWLDAFELKIGSSLRASIDRGLANSRFGVVVLSPAFFKKQFPQSELNGLFARQMDGMSVILPIWHQITKAELLKHSPMIADIFACSSHVGVHALARALIEVIRPEILRGEKLLERVELATEGLRDRVQWDPLESTCRHASLSIL